MTTSETKTRALCVATRCTSVDQFVATFHRFCGDDQSFFVATLTSRPIGLETPFSIQLADKQPVLRGLCIVLDAWATPENRYRRPGIRLGIKRLTADSQLVFDRLRAASKSVGAVEATPPPGPPPELLVSRGSPPPEPPLASRGSPPPALPPVSRGSPPELPPASRGVPPSVPARPTVQPPPLPRVITGRRDAVPDSATPPPLPAIPAVEPSPPPPDARPLAVVAEPGSRPAAVPAPATPIAVTRFQVALNVDGTLPPTDAIEFRPRQLPNRPRIEARIVSDPEPGAGAYEPGTPAMIVDRPSDPLREPLPAIDLRTPGSSLVLPANPLQNLSDESIEGFVDCTLYEESGNFFHPPADDDEWNDALADPPAEPLSTRTARPGTVPAMPFDTAPDLTILARGNSESLRVAPDAPSDSPPQAMPPQAMPEAMPPHRSSPVTGSIPLFTPPWPDAANLSGPAYPAYPTIDASQYPPQYATPQPSTTPHIATPQPGTLPERETLRLSLSWPRWLIIGGTAIAAIVVAFIVAKLVRGSPRAESARAAVSSVQAPPARPAAIPSKASAAPSSAAPSSAAPSSAAPSSASPSSASPSGAAPSNAATPKTTVQGSSPPSPVVPDEDNNAGDVAPGGVPIVGQGPCRLTIATTPAASIIRLDDQAMGPSPLSIDATCEKHRVDISHARYQSVTRWVTLAADKPNELEVSLPRPIHAVTVTSFPPGAELSIDGRRAGTTPTIVQMMGFATVNLTFTKAGFQSVTKKVYSKSAQDRVFVKLMK